MRRTFTPPQVERAHAIANIAHDGQERLSGTPYITHVEEVARIASGLFGDLFTPEEAELITATSLLHDAPEHHKKPSEYIGWLKDIGVSTEVLDALDCLTRREDIDGQGTREEYFSYINRLSTNTLARRTKIADVMHNMANPIPYELLMKKEGEAIPKATYVYGAVLQVLWDAEITYQASQIDSATTIQTA